MADVTISNLTGRAPSLTDVFPFSTTGVGPATYKATLAQLKSSMSLNNVENKSSATIRSEITSSNVTTALGYTPYNSSNPNGYITAASIPPVPKFAYAIMSQSNAAPYTVTLIASKNVASVTADASSANVIINWTSNYFDNENYCVTFGVRSDFCGNRSAGLNMVCSSAGAKTRNQVVVMGGSSSSGGFTGLGYFNVMAIQ